MHDLQVVQDLFRTHSDTILMRNQHAYSSMPDVAKNEKTAQQTFEAE